MEDAIQSFLGVQTAWAAELLRHGLSGGHLFTVVNTGGGRWGPIMLSEQIDAGIESYKKSRILRCVPKEIEFLC